MACAIPNAPAADAFPYDRQLALDLAEAYLKAYNRHNTGPLTAISFAKPVIHSAIAAHGRRLVFLSYASSNKETGAYVELELCRETSLLTAVDVGIVDNITAYRREASHITPAVYVASPIVCPAEVP